VKCGSPERKRETVNREGIGKKGRKKRHCPHSAKAEECPNAVDNSKPHIQRSGKEGETVQSKKERVSGGCLRGVQPSQTETEK